LHYISWIFIHFYRGTNTIAQFIKATEQTLFHKKIPWIAGGYVSKYFYNAFNAVWNGGLKEKFEQVLKTHPLYGVWVTGHSLGGSMASLAASHIVANGYVSASNVKLVTFGQPRTGDVDFAKAINAQGFYSFRIVHRRD
ncbi:triacylglycerol lipase, partial [Ancylostoma caninum]